MSLIIPNITGVILAGGRATRMAGQDKGLVELQGQCMIQHVINRLRLQVTPIFISANRNQQRYAELTGCPVLTDTLENYAGPLAGIATALQTVSTDYVLFVPCDAPCLDLALVSRLYAALTTAHTDTKLSVAHDGTRLQPLFALLKRDLLSDLLNFLAANGRSVERWYNQQVMVKVDFSDVPSSFLNINTLEELTMLTGQELL